MDSGQSEKNRSKGPKDNKCGRGGVTVVYLDKDVSLVGTWRSLLPGRIPYPCFLGKGDGVREGLRMIFLHLMFFQNSECHSLELIYPKHYRHLTDPLRPYIHLPFKLLVWTTSFFYAYVILRFYCYFEHITNVLTCGVLYYRVPIHTYICKLSLQFGRNIWEMFGGVTLFS